MKWAFGPALWLGVACAALHWLAVTALAGGDGKFVQILLSPSNSELMHRSVVGLGFIGLGLFAQFHLNRKPGSEQLFQRLWAEQRSLLENVPVAFMQIRGNEVVRANDYLETMIGWSPSDYLGRSPQMFCPDYAAYKRAIKLGTIFLDDAQPENLEVELKHKDGSTVPARVRGGWLDPKDPDQGAIWLLEDISAERKFQDEREQLLKKLETNLDRLSQSQQLARVGDWEYEPETGAIWWSDQVYRIFGLDPQKTKIDLDLILEMCHPKDRDRTAVLLARRPKVNFTT